MAGRTYTTRDFRCVPVALLYDETLGKLTTFQLLMFLAAQVAKDDRHCLPYEATVLRSVLFPNRPSVNVGDVAAARDRLLHEEVGAFVRKSSARKVWIEIAPAFRHENGKHFGYGDEEDDPWAVQQDLPLGPLGEVPRVVRAGKCNGVKKRIRTDTTRRVEDASAPPDATARTRALSSDGTNAADDGRFALDEDAFPGDEVWRDLNNFLGLVEMFHNGKRWAHVLQTERGLLGMVLGDCKAKTPDEVRKIENRGAYLTERMESARVRARA